MKTVKQMTLPNKLTILRLFFVAVVLVFGIIEHYFTITKGIIFTINEENIIFPWTRIIMFITFLAASLTDRLDGKIARKTNTVTDFGKFIDPVADKTLHNSLVIFFACLGYLPFYVPAIYICRDTLVDGMRMIASTKNKVIAASFWGKTKTVLQFVELALLFILAPLFEIYHFTEIIVIVVTALAVIASVLSGADYIIKNKKVIFEDA